MQNIYNLIVGIFLCISLNGCVLTSSEDAVEIKGTIRDSSGIGIKNVKIYIYSNSYTDSIYSSDGGAFKILIPQGGISKIVFQKEGFTSQQQIVQLKGGDKTEVDITLNSLQEDAFLNIGQQEFNVANNGKLVSAQISTNVLYQLRSEVDWIVCEQASKRIIITVEDNETLAERVGKVFVTAEYGIKDTIIIVQSAGPTLKLLNFIGKDNLTSYPENAPFLTFNKEVRLISVTSSQAGLDLSAKFSDDKKTIAFSNLTVPYFANISISYVVEAIDGVQTRGNFDLKPYINLQSNQSGNAQKIIFTNDNKYIWIYTAVYSGTSTLKQYATKDFSLLKTINLLQPVISFTYNPFNNSLYLNRQVYNSTENYSEIDVYDANVGNLTKTIQFEDRHFYVDCLAFSRNGFGLMRYKDKIYYIDSSKNHEIGIFSANSMLYDPYHGNILVKEIRMCNDNSTFVLYGLSKVFTVDLDSKTIKQVYSGSEFQTLAANNRWSGAALSSTYTNSIIYLNFDPGIKQTISIQKGVYNMALLDSDDNFPVILCENLSLVSTADATEKFLQSNSYNNYVYSSNDGKLALINYNSNLYLFNSKALTSLLKK